MDRVRIVLDIDVVSLYRTGRLPPGFAHHVATNDLSITFATAGELPRSTWSPRWSAGGTAGCAAAATGSTRGRQ